MKRLIRGWTLVKEYVFWYVTKQKDKKKTNKKQKKKKKRKYIVVIFHVCISFIKMYYSSAT